MYVLLILALNIFLNGRDIKFSIVSPDKGQLFYFFYCHLSVLGWPSLWIQKSRDTPGHWVATVLEDVTSSSHCSGFPCLVHPVKEGWLGDPQRLLDSFSLHTILEHCEGGKLCAVGAMKVMTAFIVSGLRQDNTASSGSGLCDSLGSNERVTQSSRLTRLLCLLGRQ